MLPIFRYTARYCESAKERYAKCRQSRKLKPVPSPRTEADKVISSQNAEAEPIHRMAGLVCDAHRSLGRCANAQVAERMTTTTPPDGR